MERTNVTKAAKRMRTQNLSGVTKAIGGILIASFLWAPLAEAAVSTANPNPSLNNAAEAQGYLNYFTGRVTWAQSQTDLPASVLQDAQYALNNFQNVLIQAGYTQLSISGITTPGLSFRYTPGFPLALK